MVVTPLFSEHVGDLTMYPILREIIVLHVLWSQAKSVYQLSWNETYQTLMSESLQVATRANRSLLELVCDVVVELDGDLLLTNASKPLATVFGSSKPFTKGTALPPLFKKQDEERLRRHLQDGGSTSSSGVGSFAAQVQDCFGVPINIDLFFITFEPTGGGRHYLVGLREFTDLPAAPEMTTHSKAPKVVPLKGKGTPSAIDSIPLTLEPSPRHRLSVSSAAFQATLSCSCLKPTNDYIKLHALKRLLLQWNVQMNRQACCALHAHIHECMCILKKLKRESCLGRDSFAVQMGDEQCTRCGMVVFHSCDSASEADDDEKASSCMWCSSCTSSKLRSLSSVSTGTEKEVCSEHLRHRQARLVTDLAASSH
eukprot:TRINITY_DN15251_c0_g1_i1.p1 TRINITY_DN15251_c0_g1~~TRINITY_DN15251_c0_g1_i1.p1  ORF type:complete len:414 (-),score=51.42 TRINITY_DN15251_c0_g1_i1:256-1362(-)